MGSSWASTRTFSNPPIATSASLAPFSIPATSADIATKLETPRMMPNIVSKERNLCDHISLSPVWIVIQSWLAESTVANSFPEFFPQDCGNARGAGS
jgi:hypothetical protein